MIRVLLAIAIVCFFSPLAGAQTTSPSTTPMPDKVDVIPATTPSATSMPESSPAPDSGPTTSVATGIGGTAKSESLLPPEKLNPVKLVMFTKPPLIDGKLDDEVWKSAPVFKDFHQWRPSDTSTASAKTEMMAGYDARFIYFAFHAYDDPAKVRASVAKRDSIFDDDTIGVILDTFNDKRRAW